MKYSVKVNVPVSVVREAKSDLSEDHMRELLQATCVGKSSSQSAVFEQWHSEQNITVNATATDICVKAARDPSAYNGGGADIVRATGWLAYEFDNVDDAILFKLTFGGE